MKNLILSLIINLVPLLSHCQSEYDDKGQVNLHFGTLMVYSTYSLGYEGGNLFKKSNKHQLRPIIRVGGWNSSFQYKNRGIQSAIGLTYLYGKGNHLFEHSSEIVFHFDKGLKGQSSVYIGSLYRLYFGYRFQPVNKKFSTKVGLGWKELFQIGFGYKL